MIRPSKTPDKAVPRGTSSAAPRSSYLSMLVGVLALCVALTILFAGTALAAGTGDNPNPKPDTLTAKEQADRAKSDVAYTLWLKAQSQAAAGVITPMTAPAVMWLYTPSHMQERTYWCGPATVQVIHDYFGTPVSQLTYANHMGTTQDGTDFTVVDDELRYRTSLSYYWRAVSTSTDFFNRVQNTIGTNLWPATIDGKIEPGELGYNYEHLGHILPVEGYDYQSTAKTMRKDDVYNEADNYSGGGQTFGHQIYDRAQFYHVVERHFLHSLVGA